MRGAAPLTRVCSFLVQEFDVPSALYARPSGIFRGMCDRSAITLDDIRLAAKARMDADSESSIHADAPIDAKTDTSGGTDEPTTA